ncbi:T9SS type A sorting domain-containing protein [Hymenobacter terrenus]|uniref:T9SS type A sorting domain-containing protein n=1 Tax=Hymenobacter terrenus TaxID=1629124 RepID=UPI0009E3C448|nr:T9SS type A sorting domain-containing protein [Hymenobacter terrenus]
MKHFTRCVLLLSMLALSLAPAVAANITILVGDNFYRGPGVTTGDSDIRTITVGDVVTWSYVGVRSHPTASDSSPAAWTTFPMNAANTSFTLTFNTVGVFPYHCIAHGSPGSGQYGILTVQAAVPTATLNARTAGIDVSIFPNPSRGQVTLQLLQLNQKASANYANYKLRLNNIIGQEVRTIALKPEVTSTGLPLDLSDLHAGIYFCNLLIDGKVVTTKRITLQN